MRASDPRVRYGRKLLQAVFGAVIGAGLFARGSRHRGHPGLARRRPGQRAPPPARPGRQRTGHPYVHRDALADNRPVTALINEADEPANRVTSRGIAEFSRPLVPGSRALGPDHEGHQ